MLDRRIVRTLVAALTLILSAAPAPASTTAARDGSRDFDFDLGTWRTDIVRQVRPIGGTGETMHLTGTVTVRPLWGGKAQVEEIEADGPRGHWEGMTVFLYDPDARQWSMNFANSASGKFTIPMIGDFRDGRGELVGTDTFDGRGILVRATWSDITPNSHTYQETYSDDGGKSWHVAFTAHKTRMSAR